MKKLIVGFIMLFGVLFLLSIVFLSKFLLNDDEQRFHTYWEEKEIQIAGKIMDYSKASARNKSFAITPSVFEVNGDIENLAMGFVNKDTTICIVIAPRPKVEVDSLVINSSSADFYYNHNKVATEEIQLLRWNTIQRTELKQEEKYGELDAF